MSRAVAPARPATPSLRIRERAEAFRWAWPWAPLGAVFGLAVTLRAVGLAYGLPLRVLNPDEPNIVPRAWGMVHGRGLDPHWFDYPTLLMYVFAPFQAWQPHPSLLTARVIVALLGMAGVGAAWWLGARAYGTLAGLVAAACVAVETTHVRYSHMAVTDVPLTLAVTVSLVLMVTGRFRLAGVVAGLAASVKYPGALVVVPLVVAAWGRWRTLAVSLALAAVAFVATSPFVLIDLGHAVRDARLVQRQTHVGWLGFEHDHIAPVAFADRLWQGFGPALLVAVVGVVVAALRRRPADRILVSFVVVYFLYLSAFGAHFDRYVLPLVPVLGALAGRVRAVAPVTLALLVVPLTWSVREVHRLTLQDTRLHALRWVDRELSPSVVVAIDPSAPLPRARRIVGPSLAVPWRVVTLNLPAPWAGFDRRRNVAVLRRSGVRYVIVTGAVTNRVLRAADRYPRETAFYDSLATKTRRIYYLRPGHGLTGPWVAVYDIRHA